MDQQKTGEFLRQLRREKGLTQEQLGVHFLLSSRTISRWETGRNMPDIDMLIELADFYAVDIREIIDGQRKTTTAETKEILRTVAAYATNEEKRIQSKAVYIALGMSLLLLVCTRLFSGETKGLLYGVVPENVCNSILMLLYGVAAALVIAYLKAHWFQEKPSKDPVRTVKATVTAKEVKPGTHRSGRSKGGYSYVVSFLTEKDQKLELFAYEIEFGGLQEGTHGLLTFQGRYFLSFQPDTD